MPPQSKRNNKRLIWRSLQPSAGGAFVCLVLALALVAANLILQSVNVGTALPGILDGQWAVAYTERVVQPLTEILGNNTLNRLIIAGLWGTAGFAIYIGFEYLLHWSRTLREDRTSIRMARGHVIEHPLAGGFWTPVAWRAGVLVLGVVFLVAVQPLLRFALDATQDILLSQKLLEDGAKVAAAVLVWTFIFHGLVVLARLYTARTRLFGDDELY